MKLLMVASEAAPFAKTGGLADVVGSLPPALHRLGHDVRLVMPWYRQVKEAYGELYAERNSLLVRMADQDYRAGYHTGELEGVPVYFIDLDNYYDRPGLYGENGRDYEDNAERFGLLSCAALALASQLKFVPDVIHAHDWQAGLVPVYLQQQRAMDQFFANTGSLFTIHNLGYQGIFPLERGDSIGLDASLLSPDKLEYHGKLSLLKGGIRCAEEVNTVSPTYCREIQTAESGMGMDGLLRSRKDHLHGLLNGLDGRLWSPARDSALVKNYSAEDLSGKALCKTALQKELELQDSPQTPLAAMITRLDPQKGLDLILESWDRILSRRIQLVVLGTGSPDLAERLNAAAQYYPGQVRVLLQFDDALSRRIYAGSDLFLMPSRYEPCGLGQLIALRYGSVPVVHATGGLADTIIDPRSSDTTANGFVFQQYRHDSMLEAIDRALSTYLQSAEWRKLVTRGLSQDISWTRAAEEYLELYRLCTKDL